MLGVPWVAIQGQPTGTILSLIQAFEKQGILGNLKQTKQLSAPKDPTKCLFRLLKDKLQICFFKIKPAVS